MFCDPQYMPEMSLKYSYYTRFRWKHYLMLSLCVYDNGADFELLNNI